MQTCIVRRKLHVQQKVAHIFKQKFSLLRISFLAIKLQMVNELNQYSAVHDNTVLMMLDEIFFIDETKSK